MAVYFTDDGPVSEGVLTYSQSTNPDSPYSFDQTQLFSNYGWEDLYYRDEAVEAAAVRRDQVSEVACDANADAHIDQLDIDALFAARGDDGRRREGHRRRLALLHAALHAAALPGRGGLRTPRHRGSAGAALRVSVHALAQARVAQRELASAPGARAGPARARAARRVGAQLLARVVEQRALRRRDVLDRRGGERVRSAAVDRWLRI